MDYNGPENRRKHPRVSEDLKVQVTILSSPGDESLTGQKFDCHTKDISFQGMCIVGDTRFDPGLTLDLQIQARTSSRTYSFTGLIMWSKHNQKFQVYESGVQFEDLGNIPIGWKKLVVDLIIKS